MKTQGKKIIKKTLARLQTRRYNWGAESKVFLLAMVVSGKRSVGLGVPVMVKYTVFRVGVVSLESMGHITICRKNGTPICHIVAYCGQYWLNWATGEDTQDLSPKCGLLIGCHAVEIDATLKGIVLRIPRNSGFVVTGKW